MLFNSVFTIFWDFNIQCRVCYTACSVNRRETVSLFKFPIKSLMIPFELNWPVSLITIYILYVIITLSMCVREEWRTWEMASSVDRLGAIGKLKRVQRIRDGGANVVLYKSFKNLHDYWCEGNWTIVIQTRGFTVLRHRDDDRFFKGGGILLSGNVG